MLMETGKLSILSLLTLLLYTPRPKQTSPPRGPGSLYWRTIGNLHVGGGAERVEEGKSQPVKPFSSISPAPTLGREDYGRYTDDSLGRERYVPGPLPDPSTHASSCLLTTESRGAGMRGLGQGGTTTAAAVSKKAVAGTRIGLYPKGPSERRTRPAESGRPPQAGGCTVGGRGGGSERHGRGGEEAEEREAGRAGPAQQLGGATHLCSRPAEPEWPGSLATRTRRSAHAPTPPPSSRRLLQLLRLYYRRAQPGNHDGRAARAHPLPPFSPPPPVSLPKRRWPHWEQKQPAL